jgi:trimethylamine:corrinoid methyltransferase-like protein
MAGATCPLDPRSALVQALAEELAVDLLRSCLSLSASGPSLRVDPFDLQYAAIVFGSPEWCLYRALVNQMSEYLTGRPARSGMFRSVAKRPNAQAACERMASVLWQALLGVRHFGGVGQLSVDEVFSPQQAVFDKEILAYVKRIVEGLDLDSEAVDALALIQEGVREGSFVGVTDTVTRYRAFSTFPGLFRHWNLGRWRAEGEPALLDEAWARARQEIAGSTHRLEELQERQVDRIYQQAASYIGSRR